MTGALMDGSKLFWPDRQGRRGAGADVHVKDL